MELEQLITGVESGRLAELEDAELLGFAQGFERLGIYCRELTMRSWVLAMEASWHPGCYAGLRTAC